jgi:capsular exopolysaccharide synthesis family protein
MSLSFKKKNVDLHTISDVDLITKNPSSLLCEALKAARTNLMYTMSEIEGCKTVMVTSAFSAEGKTTTCINIAATLAQLQAKVLLVDADLRRPRMHTYLEVKNKEGLANHLGGFATVESIINRMEEFNFDYITAGNVPPNPAELLASKKFAAFLDSVKEKYDYIIIDTPPVNAVADALSVAASVENVLLVCRCGISITQEVKKAVSALEFAQAKILGFIAIDAQSRKAKTYETYSGYYGYR